MDMPDAELRELLTQIRISVARLEATQESFKKSIEDFREERKKTYDKMTNKIEDMDGEIKKLDKKITYASGVVGAIAAFFSAISSTILNKLGVV